MLNHQEANLTIAQKIHKELVNLLYRQIKYALWAESFAASTVIITLWNVVDHQHLCIWYLTNLLVCGLARHLMAISYKRIKPNYAKLPFWQALFSIGVLCSGISWGLAGSWLMPEHAVLYQAFVVFLVIGVSAAANPFYSPIKSIYVIFLIPAFTPFAIWLLTQPHGIYTLLGVAAFIYMALMLITSFYASKLMYSSLLLRFQNMSLVNNLTDAKVQLEETNQELINEINERKEAEISLETLATHDVLTNLPNRTLFHTRLEKAFHFADQHNTSVALLFLDLDNFKRVNDILGHNIGDKLLVAASQHLKNCLRDIDTISRLGGDEFTIILENITSTQQVSYVADRICKAFYNPFIVDDNEIYITTSIGISFYPSDANDSTTLLRHADFAMYRAKELGRNNFQFYTEEIHEKAVKRDILESQLRKALELKQFTLVYQPIIEINTQTIVGVEALLRWEHPELGTIYPNQFIPLAEESGLIVPLGKWILKTACQQARQWQLEHSMYLKVFVNLSVRQFNDNFLLEDISNTLTETGLEGHYLGMEITESLTMYPTENTLNILEQLKKLGISISIDDFGTGYSSLNYLKRFPIDTLKIDKSFVNSLPNDTGDIAILTSIIAIADSLKINVVAEGVETVQQLKFLRKQHCQYAQGYYISHPLKNQDFLQFMQKYLDKITRH